jgi:hypothetical protein
VLKSLNHMNMMKQRMDVTSYHSASRKRRKIQMQLRFDT